MAKMEKIEGSKVRLTIEVSAEQFETATQKAYQRTVKKYNVPGFRKGKAPRKVIENMYGPMAFFDDAFEIVYPEVYEAALKELAVEPVGQPDVSITELGDGGEKPLVFTAEVPVYPEVKLGAYKGIEVTRAEYTVTDEMVEEKIDQEREKVARYVDVERPVQNGDEVGLDYSGSVDGVQFDGGTAEDQTLVIGSGMFIPGFEEGMVGMKPDEERDITVTFPTPYQSKELEGKEAVFHVKVHSIRVKELPEADDDFAKDVSEFDTLAALRAAKREELEKQFAEQAKVAKENEALAKVVENAEAVIPEAMTQRQIDYMLRDISYRLSMQGMRLEDYCKYTNTTLEAMRDSMRGEAETRVKSQVVLSEIGKAEKLEATPEELEAKLGEYAEQAQKSVEEFKKDLGADELSYLSEQIVLDKTIALIMENAKEVKAKKTAAKKDAAKKDGAKKDGAPAAVKKKAAPKKTAKATEDAE